MRMVIRQQKEDRQNRNVATRTFCLPGCLCLVRPSARSPDVTYIFSRAQGPNNRSLYYSQVPVSKGKAFSGGSVVKNPPANAEDLGSIPGLGRSPGEGKGYPLHYSGLKNSMDYIVHGVTNSLRDTTKQLSLSPFKHPTSAHLSHNPLSIPQSLQSPSWSLFHGHYPLPTHLFLHRNLK